MPEGTATVLAVSVGNSRVKYGWFRAGALEENGAAPNAEAEATVRQVASRARGEGTPLVVLASVNDALAARVEGELEASFGTGVERIGRDVPIPMTHNLDDASTVGHDRLLNALGAYSKGGGACVVIDCGTAVTVDFVDGQGTFCGGAIAPGVRLMLAALHSGTAALPKVEYEAPPEARGPFGKDTRHAMLLGVTRAVQGLVHELIDRYADAYGAYPRIIATGGDAAALFDGDELVEHVVPALQLLGIHEALRRSIEGEEDVPE